MGGQRPVKRGMAGTDLEKATLHPHIGGMTRARRPHYALALIKAEFADATRIYRTMTAATGAEELGMDDQTLVDVIARLTAIDFDKSMPSDRDPAIWQDVYKPVVAGRELYVKFTVDSQGQLLLISFKENEP
jgi:motility quorum-sensing regulator/GCU-specific mRNA interferase toxin